MSTDFVNTACIEIGRFIPRTRTLILHAAVAAPEFAVHAEGLMAALSDCAGHLRQICLVSRETRALSPSAPDQIDDFQRRGTVKDVNILPLSRQAFLDHALTGTEYEERGNALPLSTLAYDPADGSLKIKEIANDEIKFVPLANFLANQASKVEICCCFSRGDPPLHYVTARGRPVRTPEGPR